MLLYCLQQVHWNSDDVSPWSHWVSVFRVTSSFNPRFPHFTPATAVAGRVSAPHRYKVAYKPVVARMFFNKRKKTWITTIATFHSFHISYLYKDYKVCIFCVSSFHFLNNCVQVFLFAAPLFNGIRGLSQKALEPWNSEIFGFFGGWCVLDVPVVDLVKIISKRIFLFNILILYNEIVACIYDKIMSYHDISW